MDKKQKELIKTYYRKRNLAAKQSNEYVFEDYEINNFVLKNNLIDFDVFSNDDVFEMILNQPQLTKYFKNRLKDFNDYKIRVVLSKQPELAKYFKNRLNDFSDNKISNYIIKQPELAKYFKNRLKNFNEERIDILISQQPKLKPYFENI